MKRFISVFMTMLLLISSMQMTAFSASSSTTVYIREGACGDSVRWHLSEDGTLTISGSGAMKDYAAASGNPLKLAPWGRVSATSSIHTVVVESGVTSLGKYTFYELDDLVNVSLPDSLISIGEGAFGRCPSLTEIEIPETVTAIEKHAFTHCKKLSSINLPTGLTMLGADAFEECSALTTIEFPDGLESIGSYAFSGSGLSGDLFIPDSVKKISEGAFQHTALTSIALPSGLETLSRSVLKGVRTLKQLEIPASVTLVAPYALSSLDGVEWIRFYGDAPEFMSSAFAFTATTVYYPKNNPTWTDEIMQDYDGEIIWRAIGDDEEAPLPPLDDGIDENTTGEGTIGDTITWSFANGVLTITGSGPMYLSEEAPWRIFKDYLCTVEISDEITVIGSGAFSACAALESIELPEQLQRIDAGAFRGCTSFKEIVIPASVEEIGGNAFTGCTALTSITFLGDPPEFGIDAFRLVTATAYHDINNTNWTDSNRVSRGGNITWSTYGELPPPPTSGVCGDDARWEYVDGVLTITGTGAMYDMWYDEAPWLPFRSELHTLVIGEGITDIGYYAFYDCPLLTDVTLPSTLKTIRYSAFAECTGLKEIDIPEGVTEVGGGAAAFEGCTSLERVSLPSTLERISTRCFSGCSSLKEIVIPENVTIIWDEAFYGCTSLKKVTLPEGLVSLGGFAFEKTGLEAIKLPSTLEYISPKAFAGCEQLTSITIPASVTSLSHHVFRDCTALGNVKFEGDAPTMDEYIFQNVTATVWYPADNATWTEDVMQQYGGTITWKSYRPGDVNGDGAVNNKDATRLFQYLAGWNVEVIWPALDVNGDGAVNNKDATRLFQYLAGWNVEIH